jgi:N-acetylmuramoyl-L-alanine amidase
MKNDAAAAKTEVTASAEPRGIASSKVEAPGASAPTRDSSRMARDAASATTDSPASVSRKVSISAKSRANDLARPREAQPTSAGERSLTRALGLKIGRIVIDAGHGGHDTGAIGPTGYREKDLVLDVALRLGRLLEQKLGAEVIYTRDDDTFIPLEERTNIANQAGADLFLSIHANFSSDTAARGVETYYLNFSASDEALEVAARENATSQKTVHELQDLVQNIALKEKIDESREFAADIQHSLWLGEVAKSPGLRNRGVKKAPFIVLIGAHMPSVLAEISFVSNAADERKLRTAEYRQRIAESLYRGISRYASGLSGVKFAASSPYKPHGQTVAGTPAQNH